MSHFFQSTQPLLGRRRLPNFRGRLERAIKNYRQRTWRSFNMVSLVSVRPAVVLTGAHPDFLAHYFHPKLENLDVTIFYRAGWSVEDEPTFRDRTTAIKRVQTRFPRHQYIFAANTPREVELLRAAGIRAEFLNENAYIDEFSFRTGDDGPKKFDAVLDAQIAPYKRLELAAKIPKLAVVTFLLDGRFDPTYSELVKKRLAHATWANGPYWEKSYRKLNRNQVGDLYRQSRVGLCFSALEGANLASIQYLLCGLPVVSTESRGGRDVFFDEECAAVVPADALAVAAAVDRFVQHPIPAISVREKTLQKIWPIRHRFSDLLCRELGHREVDEGWWRGFNSENSLRYQDFSKIVATLGAAYGLR